MEENKENNEELLDESVFRAQESEIIEDEQEISGNKEDIKEEIQEKSDAQAQTNINTDEENKEVKEEVKETEVVEDLMNGIEKEVQETNEKTEEAEKTPENLPLKKYIFYISKDFTDIIDSLSIDKRTAYINSAIQLKIDSNKTNFQNEKMRRIAFQAAAVFLTVCIATPLAIFIMNKAIMLTFDNYRYSQQNFEKLYKQRFESDRAYMRSVQYNKAYQELNKKK